MSDKKLWELIKGQAETSKNQSELIMKLAEEHLSNTAAAVPATKKVTTPPVAAKEPVAKAAPAAKAAAPKKEEAPKAFLLKNRKKGETFEAYDPGDKVWLEAKLISFGKDEEGEEIAKITLPGNGEADISLDTKIRPLGSKETPKPVAAKKPVKVVEEAAEEEAEEEGEELVEEETDEDASEDEEESEEEEETEEEEEEEEEEAEEEEETEESEDDSTEEVEEEIEEEVDENPRRKTMATKKPAAKVVAKKPAAKAPAKKVVAKAPAKKVVAKKPVAAPAKKVVKKVVAGVKKPGRPFGTAKKFDRD